MENFYGHLKSETIYQLPITQRYCLRREELKNIIDNYIIWYSNERIQAKLNFIPLWNFALKIIIKLLQFKGAVHLGGYYFVVQQV